eukprot:TRINITY_DN21490_c0_g1_i3.p1 TRINITY_DN21490_c0_g1~~TRINITY_DN21490_c0_g1_i3.p1  ORF type:complete len:130 (-),score=24.80 TRINITY_DN21490_c0_g1_i3:5-394(-)
MWSYNAVVLPISGTASFEADIEDLEHETTIHFASVDKISILGKIDCSLIEPSEIDVKNLIDADKWISANEVLLKALPSYYPILMTTVKKVFEEVMPETFKSGLKKTMGVILAFPSFHVIKDVSLGLSGE